MPKQDRKLKEKQHKVLLANIAWYQDQINVHKSQLAILELEQLKCKTLLDDFEKAHNID